MEPVGTLLDLRHVIRSVGYIAQRRGGVSKGFEGRQHRRTLKSDGQLVWWGGGAAGRRGTGIRGVLGPWARRARGYPGNVWRMPHHFTLSTMPFPTPAGLPPGARMVVCRARAPRRLLPCWAWGGPPTKKLSRWYFPCASYMKRRSLPHGSVGPASHDPPPRPVASSLGRRREEAQPGRRRGHGALIGAHLGSGLRCCRNWVRWGFRHKSTMVVTLRIHSGILNRMTRINAAEPRHPLVHCVGVSGGGGGMRVGRCWPTKRRPPERYPLPRTAQSMRWNATLHETATSSQYKLQILGASCEQRPLQKWWSGESWTGTVPGLEGGPRREPRINGRFSRFSMS